MKKILKTTCLFVSALTLVSACACHSGASGLHRRERQMQEKKLMEEQQRLLEQEILEEDVLDPDFLVEGEPSENPEEDKKEPGKPGCPHCPKHGEKTNELLPERGNVPRHGKHPKPKPAPFPQPGDDDGEEVTDSSF